MRVYIDRGMKERKRVVEERSQEVVGGKCYGAMNSGGVSSLTVDCLASMSDNRFRPGTKYDFLHALEGAHSVARPYLKAMPNTSSRL